MIKMQSWAWMIAAVLLAGCTARELPPIDPTRTVAAADVGDYRLNVGDTVKLTVYKEAELSGTYGVGADGKFVLPVVGPVQAEGRTVGEVADTVRAGLANGFMTNPQVSAEVAAYRPIYVLGEVNKPGRYDYVIGLTVQGAIATAEGFSYRANEKRVFIKSPNAPGEKEYRITPDLVVRPGEIIRVEARSF